MREINRVARADHALLHHVVIGQAAGITQGAVHHVLRADLVEHAPYGSAVRIRDKSADVTIAVQAWSLAVASIECVLYRNSRAKQHRVLIEEVHHHAGVGRIQIRQAVFLRLNAASLHTPSERLWVEIALRDSYLLDI